ncbi:hypothetical protein FOA43_000313 [Brettanomyces nanus]|uniref:Uncharacterized protein n=1 Tax=Eeniella nana TaxID=13502 RepID=A0A875RZB9_EENNA|nr:uncharacterized protein FOA43_000313 [Brettanomyces nanus]QPG73009.1 hypothetical protein FOA43_000313 [Brettanomyces nanus]
MISYQQLLPIGSLMMISTCSFMLGIFFADWPYDYYTLWDSSHGEEFFTKALDHYKTLATQPTVIISSLAGIMSIGFIGSFIKIFKPSEDTKYFEYGSLIALVSAVCIYLTNVRTGQMSALFGEWGEVSQNVGLSVIAASQVMIVVLLLGVVVLQCGLFYAEYSDYKAKTDFYMKELGEQFISAEEAKQRGSKSKPSETKTKSKPKSKPKSKANARAKTTGASSKETSTKSRKA